jgi:oligopeptide transport system substrate-binding protein
MQRIFSYVALLFFAVSCSNSEQEHENLKIFRYNELGAITSLDPAGARTLENIWACNQVYNGLIQMNDSLHAVPCIAQSWEIADSGHTYTFHLRSDVFFHDDQFFKNGKGRRVVANDFVYSFKRLLNPSVSSALSLLANIDTTNNNAFFAPNDTTFIIKLNKPFVPFLNILTMKYFSVIPKEAVIGYGNDFVRNPVGTGPFKFKIWKDGNKMVFTKNNNYFEYEGKERLPYIDAISISFLKDKESAFFSFLEGNLDMISGIEAINTDKMLTANGTLKDEFKSKYTLYKQPSLKTDYLGFLIDDDLATVKQSPINLLAVRQAINYGFNREKMITYLRKNIGIPAHSGFIPAGLPAFDSSKTRGYTYNPDKSRKLLAAAGFPQGKGLPEIALSTTEQYMELAEYIQAQLREIGISIRIDVQKASVLSEAIANNKVLFFRKSWIADYPDEENFLSLFYSKNKSPNGFNYTHFNNALFDKLYENVQKETNAFKRYEYYQKMDSLIIENACIVPLYYDEAVQLVHNNISGLTTGKMNILELKRVKMASDLNND